MNRTFNTDGYCDPELNYMVDLSGRLKEIKAMVDAEKYFTINRARQYGKTTILEMKVWRGNAYNERGEAQLMGYLDYYHLKKGYMLSFNFNKKKEIGLKEIKLGDKVLIEAVV